MFLSLLYRLKSNYSIYYENDKKLRRHEMSPRPPSVTVAAAFVHPARLVHTF